VSATETAVWRELACPRDRAPLDARGETLVCAHGHEYPYVDGIPILVLDDEIAPTQPGYWASAEQIEKVRAAVPPPVEGEAVDPYVAELILGTHGNLYKHLSAGISRYPIPDFPLPRGNGELLLDIGCNWGRWTIAAARAGYRPIGIDPSFEAIVAARRIAEQLGVDARYVVGDGRRLPFTDETFDIVFSYGVLQHFSKRDVAESVEHIRRVLKRDGYSWVQMPNALGLLNFVRLAQRRFREGSQFEVRYWRPSELRHVFGRIGPSELSTDGFFTLNPQKRDLDLLPRRFRAVVRVSDALKRVGAPTTFADSVNIRSVPH
jgi:SAM-dependent methyltransferase